MKTSYRNIALGTVAAVTLIAAAPGESFAQGRHRFNGNQGAAVAAGILGALALGAAAASAASAGPASPRMCSWSNQPVYGPWGQVMGFQPVQICN